MKVSTQHAIRSAVASVDKSLAAELRDEREKCAKLERENEALRVRVRGLETRLREFGVKTQFGMASKPKPPGWTRSFGVGKGGK